MIATLRLWYSGGMSSEPDTVGKFVNEVEAVFGPRLDAIYRFGSSFARGAQAPDARLLVLVKNIDRAALEDARPLAAAARDAGLAIRLDTARDVLSGADVLPVFVLELLDTKVLLTGSDVLADLAVDRSQLRLRVEHNLRVLHRDLLRAYVQAPDDRGLAVELRRNVRRAVYLLRAIALVCEVELPSPPTADATIEGVLGRLLPDERERWQRMRRFASFEDALEPSALVGLYCESLASFSALVDAVDRL